MNRSLSLTQSIAPTNVPHQWSSALRDRYRCALTADLSDWFDREIWQRDRGGEFDQAVQPNALLAEAPEFIWPGFMLPDALPLLGNGYGDWLCLRVGADNQPKEVVHWYHGGGDWVPWGRTLAEAIAFDTLRNRLPGQRQYYANIAAEFDQQLGPTSIPAWAAEHLPASIGRLLRDPPSDELDRVELAELMIEQNVAATAVHCECILAALDSPLRQKLQPWIARDLGINWDSDAIRWMFDNDLIQSKMIERLAAEFQCPPHELVGQDWDTAVKHALAVVSQRQDLGWAADILGWAAERSGQPQKAFQAYLQGLPCSSFADQSVRFRTHWFHPSAGKFAAARLQHLSAHWHLPLPDQSYLRLFLESKEQSLASRVTSYWMRIARQAADDSRWADAYTAYYRAGWDLGCDDLNVFQDLLTKLADAAQRSGQHARAEIARTHLRCLMSR